MKLNKTTFQDIHYLRIKPPFLLNSALGFAEFFYKNVINFKNYLYEKNIFKEKEFDAEIICVGNLTTGGVGKTPIVLSLAEKYAKIEPVAIISRGYKSKLNNKKVNVIKDFNGLKFDNGLICGDEPFQTAKKAGSNVVVITSKNRVKAIDFAIKNYGIKKIISDDGFSNRTFKKTRTIIVIDSKMRFGNSNLLPKGPLREPISEIKRADEIILVNKADNNINEAISWAKSFNKKISICEMKPKKIYNATTKAEINRFNNEAAIAFCAIGQPEQFFNYLKDFYNIKNKITFSDHHSYNSSDIKKLIETAKKTGTNILITTQKDETKIKSLILEHHKFVFNVLELENTFIEVE